jgi:shikimate kinase
VLLILIGLRGSGKTTIGRAVASQLSIPFQDLDDATTAILGAGSVSEAFTKFGQPAFRKSEVQALQTALSNSNQVLALGGGTPTAPGAAALLKQAQTAGAEILYLRATAQTLRARLNNQTHDRPPVTGADPLAEIDAVLAQRDPGYLALADFVINVDGLTEPATTAQVLASGLRTKD